MPTKHIVALVLGAVFLTAGAVGYIVNRRRIDGAALTDKQKERKKIFFAMLLIGAWCLLGAGLTLLSGKKGGLAIEFEMFSPRVPLFGSVTVGQTTLIGCGVLAVLAVLLILFRAIAVPRFRLETPTRLQEAMEFAVDTMEGFVRNSTAELAVKGLTPYMMSVALYMFGCALSEMFGLRAPTSELTFTLSLGLCTLGLINIYGFRKKGVFGRVKSLPVKLISEVSVPISLACRLFGNMMGGMLVMDMLKGVLGGYGSGLPAVAGIYFNLIHPVLQIYIFITLSLTYINEAMD